MMKNQIDKKINNTIETYVGVTYLSLAEHEQMEQNMEITVCHCMLNCYFGLCRDYNKRPLLTNNEKPSPEPTNPHPETQNRVTLHFVTRNPRLTCAVLTYGQFREARGGALKGVLCILHAV